MTFIVVVIVTVVYSIIKASLSKLSARIAPGTSMYTHIIIILYVHVCVF